MGTLGQRPNGPRPCSLPLHQVAWQRQAAQQQGAAPAAPAQQLSEEQEPWVQQMSGWHGVLSSAAWLSTARSQLRILTVSRWHGIPGSPPGWAKPCCVSSHGGRMHQFPEACSAQGRKAGAADGHRPHSAAAHGPPSPSPQPLTTPAPLTSTSPTSPLTPQIPRHPSSPLIFMDPAGPSSRSRTSTATP